MRSESKAMAEGKAASSMGELAAEFERLRRRAVRQKRTVAESLEAWQRWSATIDEAMAIVDLLAASPARTIDDLTVKFSALLKAIEFNASIVDATDLQHLKRFGRDLARLREQR
jgi:hypothetical protein